MIKITLALITLGSLVVLACSQAPAPVLTPAPDTKPAVVPTTTPTQPASVSPAAKRVLLNFVTGSMSGTIYYHAAIAASLWNTFIPDLNVTVLETGGALDNIGRFKRGEAQILGGQTQGTVHELWTGTGDFQKDGPFKKLRFLTNIGPKQYLNVVRADTDITKPEDLEGKKFSPGDAAGATARGTIQIYEALGIKPDWQFMTSTQGVAAFKDRRIVGYVQAGSSMTDLAASTIDLAATMGINILSFTKEQQDKAQKTLPWIPWFIAPAGSYEQGKDLPEIRGYGSTGGVLVHPDVSQNITYQMYKILDEKRKIIGGAYKGVLQVEPIVGEIQWLEILPDPPPLAAGFVQYAVEKGVTVPQRLIPPEYVPVAK